MNEINVKRMVLAGGATLLVWIAVEIALEGVIARLLFGNLVEEMWQSVGLPRAWSAASQLVNLGVALVNSIVLIWLYASLRPMYGVGTKTALITSAYGIVWLWSLIINVVNLGLIPARVGVIEGVFETIEFPIAILAGAAVYEGAGGGAE